MEPAQIAVTLGGVVAIAALAWYFFGPKAAVLAEVRGGVQEVQVAVKGGYVPSVIRARQGVPLRLVFDRQESSDCTALVVFPDFGVSRSLPAFGTTVVELMPERPGEFGFACGMNMVHGTLIVDPADGVGTSTGDGHAHAVARAVGVGPTREVGRTRTVEFGIRGHGITCMTCVMQIESALKGLPGIDRVDGNYGADRVTVASGSIWDPTRP